MRTRLPLRLLLLATAFMLSVAPAAIAQDAAAPVVAFAGELAEFDPAFGASGAILADSRDGKPLDAHEGPFRIVVPEEKRQGRWVRQVTGIALRSAGK